MKIDLTGKTAIVTGGYGAIGSAMCEYFVEAGANVVVVGRNAKKGEEFVQHLVNDMNGKAAYVYGDVSSYESMETMVAETVKTFGTLDILINNAGINVGADGRAYVDGFKDEDWDSIVHTDLYGVYYCSKAAIKQMIKQGNGGRIVNIASIVGEASLRNQCAFNAAKAGVINMTKSMAMELAKHEINVNCICPGSIMFEGTRKIFYKDPVSAEKMMSHIPQHRAGDPEDIAGMTIMLSSDKIKYMTGDVVTIDGGWIAGYSCDGLE